MKKYYCSKCKLELDFEEKDKAYCPICKSNLDSKKPKKETYWEKYRLMYGSDSMLYKFYFWLSKKDRIEKGGLKE